MWYFKTRHTQAVKYPHKVYWYLQLLVGLDYDNPLVQQYKKWFPFYDIIKDEGIGLGGVCSKIPLLCYAPMPVKTTIMLQPHVYYAHNMLMNNIN